MVRPEERIELVVEKHAAGRTSIPAVSGGAPSDERMFSATKSRAKDRGRYCCPATLFESSSQAHRPAARMYAVRWCPFGKASPTGNKAARAAVDGKPRSTGPVRNSKGLCGRRLVGGPVGFASELAHLRARSDERKRYSIGVNGRFQPRR